MQKISRNCVIYKFDKDNPPAITIEPGETVILETEDCFSNQITFSGEPFDAWFDYDRLNPATGPIEVLGAEPGDTLEVEIVQIVLAETGVIATKPGWGPLGKRTQKGIAKVVKISKAGVELSDQVILPLRPMVGVIGTAPPADPIPCHTPGPHGGNLDTRWITEGARVYLPIFVRGALLALGDVHAVMADGEVCGTGVECRAEVTVKISIRKDLHITCPIVVHGNKCYIISSSKDIETAFSSGLLEVMNLLQRTYNLTWEEAYMLASIAADLEICQIVNPLKTVRIAIPKKLTNL